jgi:hypothetical protein
MTSELPSPAPSGRTYTLRGLGQRDATVFKSMLRLLAGKTRDRWTAVDTGPADLLVVAGGSPVQAAGTVLPRMQVLRVEAAGRGARADTLVLPLRAEEVCTQLDRAGERLAAMPSRSVAVSCRLQLIRWPSAQLLGADPQYLRLATILGTRPTTLDELADKSDCPESVCEAFAATMHVNGAGRWIVEPLEAAAPVARAVAGTARDEVPAGLLSRIRSRLSL